MNLIINKRKLLFTDVGIRSVGLASALTRRSYNIYRLTASIAIFLPARLCIQTPMFGK